MTKNEVRQAASTLIGENFDKFVYATDHREFVVWFVGRLHSTLEKRVERKVIEDVMMELLN